MTATWQSRHPNDNAPDPDIELDRPLINLHSWHDFRDVAGDLKRDPGREWERNQQPEKIPGVKL